MNQFSRLAGWPLEAKIGHPGGSNQLEGSHTVPPAYRVDLWANLTLDMHTISCYPHTMSHSVIKSSVVPSGTAIISDDKKLKDSERFAHLRKTYPNKKVVEQIPQPSESERIVDQWRNFSMRGFLKYHQYCSEVPVTHPKNRLSLREFKIAWCLSCGASPDILVVIFKSSLIAMSRIIRRIAHMLTEEPKTVTFINHWNKF
jgi:hypothetical protein